MKNILLLLLNIILLITVSAQPPAIQWQKKWGGSCIDQANCVIRTTDGGYAAAGWSCSNNGDVLSNIWATSVFWLVKSDSSGNILWEKSFGSGYEEKAYSIVQTSDGGYAIAGSSDGNFTNSGDVTGHHGTIDFWVVKISSAGIIQWQKSLGGIQNETAYSIIQSTDGGYVIVGSSASISGDVTGNHGSGDLWVVKLNSSGIMQWQYALGGSSGDAGYSVIQTIDSGYAIAGYSYSNNGNVSGNHGYMDCWVVKLSSTGSLQWQKSLGGSNDDRANAIIQTNDGGYVIVGSSNSNDGDVSGHHGSGLPADYWVVKLNTTGNLQWQKSLGGTGLDEARSVLQTADGGLIVAGNSVSTDGDVTGNHGVEDYWVVKLDVSGNMQWQKTLGGSNSDYATSILKSNDGGYVVVGFSASIDGDATSTHGSSDYWVVKLGCSSVATNITATNTTICANDSAQLCAPAGLAGYNWNTGANTPCIYTSLAGNYYVTVTDNNGCSAASNHVAVAVYPLPSVSTSVNGDTLTAYSSAFYQWYWNGNPINGATSNVYIATEGGNYFVKVTDSNGCEAFSSDIMISGVQNLNNDLEFTISPNPVNSNIEVIFSNNLHTLYDLEVTDIMGKRIFAKILTERNNSINLKAYPNGFYLIKVKETSSGIEVVKKILKQ